MEDVVRSGARAPTRESFSLSQLLWAREAGVFLALLALCLFLTFATGGFLTSLNLINVGRQDLTAHVDLTAVERAAADAGLDRLGSATQASFLLGLGIQDLLQRAQADRTTTAASYLALRSGIVRLLDPRATGAFAVLAFGRGVPPESRLRGLG